VIRAGLVTALLAAALPAAAHTSDCSPMEGVRKARCERHEVMYKKCGPLKGDAHFACDREFLIANPLKCDGFSGNDAAACNKEVAAFAACEANPGIEFMRCVRKATSESPMGH
jgi:hypothetical protein